MDRIINIIKCGGCSLNFEPSGHVWIDNKEVVIECPGCGAVTKYSHKFNSEVNND